MILNIQNYHISKELIYCQQISALNHPQIE